MIVGMIWAQDQKRIIGDGTGMLWHVPADFAHFKKTTTGHPVIMGRVSWEDLKQALPNRQNIVVTRQTDFVAPGALVAPSLEAAFQLVKDAPEIWIIGGSQIYSAAMDRATQLTVTELDLSVDTKTPRFAPQIDPQIWEISEAESDTSWRPKSGDARWKVLTYRRRALRS